jgi:eukaryotic-like serine/threonine-protein kinase
MSLEAGTQLGNYRILSRIGTGAYGEVYEAEHAITRRHDALKILTGRVHSAEEEQRFVQEIRLQASLQHPNIAAVYNAFGTPHGLALVMELVPGEPLSAFLARGRIAIERGVPLVLEMLAALAYAHSRGVVHRDIKPENIIVTPEGSVKLTDFGLARSATSPRLTQMGLFAGSPCYMSPEQARGTETADSRSDTYSAGVVLYEVATGQSPFTGESTFEVLLAHQYSAPPPPEEVEPAVSAALSQVILTALEKEPERRYQDAGEFYLALENAAACAAPTPEKARSTSLWRNRLALAACGCVLAGAGMFSAVVLYPKTTPLARSAGMHAASDAPDAAVPTASEPAKPAPSVPAIEDTQAPAPLPLKTAAARTALEPPPAPLHFTGSAPDAAAPAPSSGVSAAYASAPARPQAAPATAAPEPPVEPPVAPQSPAPGAAVPPEESITEAAAEPDAAKAPSVKRRNAVVRLFQRVFHQHPKASGTELPAAATSDKQP